MPTSDQLLAQLKTLHPRRMDLSLSRIEVLLAKLGNPQHRLAPVIHIAGTNGKGSTAAFLKAMLEAAGKRVHVYTSPHLVRFHERIALAGPDGKARPITETELVERLGHVQGVNGGGIVTFFEITTAAALLAFAENPADAVILEVGLGGRLDATNVIERPALTIITPISMDHTEWLGKTLTLIAREKAGIIKQGVGAVISQQPDEALEAISARANMIAAPLTVWGRDYQAFEQRGRLVYQSEERLMDLPLPALMGRHQITNAGTAVAAALHLKTHHLTNAMAIERGLTRVLWPARMQRLTNGPLPKLLNPGAELWLDGGHNPAGGAAIAQTLAELEERAPKPVALVFGMLGTKDAKGFLAPFRGLVRHIATVPIKGSDAAQDATALAAIAVSIGFSAVRAEDVGEAIIKLQSCERVPLRILICGSLYLAGEVLALQEGLAPHAN
jgi:dihydrofolate synthase / folylpolyglutamate synthase